METMASDAGGGVRTQRKQCVCENNGGKRTRADCERSVHQVLGAALELHWKNLAVLGEGRVGNTPSICPLPMVHFQLWQELTC